MIGTVAALGLTPCDYFECPARYDDTSATGGSGSGEADEGADSFTDNWVKIWSPSAKDPTWSDK